MDTMDSMTGAPPVAVSVVVVDDHPVVLRGLVATLRDDARLRVDGVAGTSADAVTLVARTQPQVVLLDLTLGTENGLDLIPALKARAPHVRILVLSALDEATHAVRALRAGAHGYIEKTQTATDLVAAMHRVAEGRIWVSDATSERILSGIGGAQPGGGDGHPFDALSDRERHVVQLVGRGMSTREIANELHVAFKTVEAHYAHIKHKAGIRTGRELTRLAVLWAEGHTH